MLMNLNRKVDGSQIAVDVTAWKDAGGYAEVEFTSSNGDSGSLAVCETAEEVERRFNQAPVS